MVRYFFVPSLADQTKFTHEPGDAVPAGINALAPILTPGPCKRRRHRGSRREPDAPPASPCRRSADEPRAAARVPRSGARGDLQRVTRSALLRRLSCGLRCTSQRGGRGSSSTRKKGRGCLRISFARRSSRFSFPQLGQPLTLVCWQAILQTTVDLGLFDPAAHRLAADPELDCDSGDYAVAVASVLGCRLTNHADCSLTKLTWVTTLGGEIALRHRPLSSPETRYTRHLATLTPNGRKTAVVG